MQMTEYKNNITNEYKTIIKNRVIYIHIQHNQSMGCSISGPMPKSTPSIVLGSVATAACLAGGQCAWPSGDFSARNTCLETCKVSEDI